MDLLSRLCFLVLPRSLRSIVPMLLYSSMSQLSAEIFLLLSGHRRAPRGTTAKNSAARRLPRPIFRPSYRAPHPRPRLDIDENITPAVRARLHFDTRARAGRLDSLIARALCNFSSECEGGYDCAWNCIRVTLCGARRWDSLVFGFELIFGGFFYIALDNFGVGYLFFL